MIIGILRLSLYLGDNVYSLKDKRQIVSSVKAKIKNRFECLCAEIDELDIWNKAVLGVACISGDKKIANGILSKAVNYVEANHDVEVADVQMEFIDI